MKSQLFFLAILIVSISIFSTSCQKQVDYSPKIDSLQKQINDLIAQQAAINTIQSNLLNLQRRSDSLALALTITNSNLQATNNTVSNLGTSLTSLQIQVTTITNQITSLNSQLSSSNANISLINVQITDLNSQLSYLRFQLNAISAEVFGLPTYFKNGLIAYYPFNGNANDESGNENNGTVHGSLLSIDRFGKTNSAYTFNGNNNNIVMQRTIDNINELSVSIWFKITNLNGGGNMLTQNNPINCTNVNYAAEYLFSSNAINSGFSNGNCSNVGSNSITSFITTTIFNSWHNRIFTLSKLGEAKEYIDGILVSSNKIGSFNWCVVTNSSLRIGGPWWNSDYEYFNGQLDDIGLWNKVLTPQEITQLYTSTNYN